MFSFVFFVLRRLRKFFDRPPPTKNRNLLAPSRQDAKFGILFFLPLRLCVFARDIPILLVAASPRCRCAFVVKDGSLLAYSSPMSLPHFALVSFKSSSLI